MLRWNVSFASFESNFGIRPIELEIDWEIYFSCGEQIIYRFILFRANWTSISQSFLQLQLDPIA